MSEIKLDPFCAIWAKCICCGAKSRCEETEEKSQRYGTGG